MTEWREHWAMLYSGCDRIHRNKWYACVQSLAKCIPNEKYLLCWTLRLASWTRESEYDASNCQKRQHVMVLYHWPMMNYMSIGHVFCGGRASRTVAVVLSPIHCSMRALFVSKSIWFVVVTRSRHSRPSCQPQIQSHSIFFSLLVLWKMHIGCRRSGQHHRRESTECFQFYPCAWNNARQALSNKFSLKRTASMY